MTDDRQRLDRILDKLGQRESWAYIAGIALGAVAVIGSVAFGENFDETGTTAVIISVITALLGTGATGQIKRGQQRGEEAARAIVAAAQGAPQQTSSSGTTQTIGGGSTTTAGGTIAPTPSALRASSQAAITPPLNDPSILSTAPPDEVEPDPPRRSEQMGDV